MTLFEKINSPLTIDIDAFEKQYDKMDTELAEAIKADKVNKVSLLLNFSKQRISTPFKAAIYCKAIDVIVSLLVSNPVKKLGFTMEEVVVTVSAQFNIEAAEKLIRSINEMDSTILPSIKSGADNLLWLVWSEKSKMLIGINALEDSEFQKIFDLLIEFGVDPDEDNSYGISFNDLKQQQ